MMSIYLGFQWDIEVRNRSGQLVVAVEVKTKLNAAPDWAAKFRSNLLAHEEAPKAPYFLMAFPDRLFLWVESDGQFDREPDYIIDAVPIFQPYFERTGIQPEQIYSDSFTLMVGAWLSELTLSKNLAETSYQSQSWLIDSGLYSAISGGQLQYEELA
ncbi:hypothetical protein [Leptolyngbya sp. FACHB-17]|uniref:hypothetical protein n=1 Tax=unclassified Leptolyngbya TaxID=2650499 RepID=UPI00168040B1|nr:hypothetical protein [Leptolyngbya sp. FACHB-17]MBD2081427.1 hypothetical protein [Leptolyngbya sp. FACHB-17]